MRKWWRPGQEGGLWEWFDNQFKNANKSNTIIVRAHNCYQTSSKIISDAEDICWMLV